ncbi:MAG TPA: VOC family protein [Thermoleophilaceae bacterium]|jgi:predicted enzyme related to lactoylglutathione lyase|nr:VOC family protein [Thermoleophilaceae bacterium]
MSERDGYAHGVPCFVSGVFPDPAAAVAFYSDLFGWEAEDLMPAEHPGSYLACRLRGRDVAAIVSQHGAPAPPRPVWTTLIWVDSVDEAAANAAQAGGTVVGEPFDSPGGGRQAVLADPAGAVFSVWEPRERRGAQLVNEPGAWSMSALNSPDPEGAKRFYGGLFGWGTETFDMGGAEMTMWTVPGYVGGEPEQPVPRDVVATMIPPGAAGDAPPHWSVDFWVADVDAACARVADRGGEIHAGPYDIPNTGLRQAVVADPLGASLSLTQPPGVA